MPITGGKPFFQGQNRLCSAAAARLKSRPWWPSAGGETTEILRRTLSASATVAAVTVSPQAYDAASGDGLHGRLWGVARRVMGDILKFLRFGPLNLFSADSETGGGYERGHGHG